MVSKTILKTAALGMPSILFTYSQDTSYKYLPFKSDLHVLFEAKPFLPFVLLFVPIVAIPMLDWYREYKEEHEPSISELSALITALDRIVGEKKSRFSKTVGSTKTSVKACEIFQNITQPDSQIISLLKEFFHYLVEVTKNQNVKLVLARVHEQKIDSWHCCIPSDEMPNDELLGNEKTVFHQSLASGAIKFVPNIPAAIDDGRYYRIGDGDNCGSMIVVPIGTANKKDGFVLSMKIDQSSVFSEDFYKKHKLMISSIKKRIELENHLLELKSISYTKGMCT
jgi:hypothetical protein